MMNRSVRASITSTELSFRLTRIARASFVNSSMMLSVRRPARRGSDPGQSHRTRHGSALRPQPNAGPIVQPEPTFLGLFLWDFRPSRRQIRSTLLWFTCEPLLFSIPVIMRYP